MRGAIGDENALFARQWLAAFREVPVSGRFAKLVTKVSTALAVECERRRRIDLEMSERELAETANCSQSQVNRVVSSQPLRAWIARVPGKCSGDSSKWRLVLPSGVDLPCGAPATHGRHPYQEPDHDIWAGWNDQFRYWIALDPNVPFSEQDIAEMLGCHLSTARRAMKKLTARGLVQLVSSDKEGRKVVRRFVRLEPTSATHGPKLRRQKRNDQHEKDRQRHKQMLGLEVLAGISETTKWRTERKTSQNGDSGIPEPRESQHPDEDENHLFGGRLHDLPGTPVTDSSRQNLKAAVLPRKRR